MEFNYLNVCAEQFHVAVFNGACGSEAREEAIPGRFPSILWCTPGKIFAKNVRIKRYEYIYAIDSANCSTFRTDSRSLTTIHSLHSGDVLWIMKLRISSRTGDKIKFYWCIKSNEKLKREGKKAGVKLPAQHVSEIKLHTRLPVNK